MKRTIVAALALALAAVSVVPAFADEPNLNTPEGAKKFWQDQQDSRGGPQGGGGDSGGGGNGG